MPRNAGKPTPSCFEPIKPDSRDRDGLPSWVGLWKYKPEMHKGATPTSKTDEILGDIIESAGQPFEPIQSSVNELPPRAVRAEWVFRGQEDSNWDVMPSTRRESHAKGCPSQPFFALEAGLFEKLAQRSFGERARLLERVKKALSEQDIEEWRKIHSPTAEGVSNAEWYEIAPLLHAIRCAAEFQAVHDFARLADDTGLVIHDSMSTLPSGDASLVNSEAAWEPSETTALAQHHGIETKLLDWTRRVKVAAYFATQPKEAALTGYMRKHSKYDAARQVDEKEDFAIWALNAACLTRGPQPDRRDLSRVRVLECNQAANRFLHAQDGLFTWFDEKCQLAFYRKHRRYPSIVDVLATEGLAAEGVLQKFVVTREVAAEMRNRLRADRISRATVMPTYDHVATSVRYEWFDKPRMG